MGAQVAVIGADATAVLATAVLELARRGVSGGEAEAWRWHQARRPSQRISNRPAPARQRVQASVRAGVTG